jgi:hypothetical protein
MLRLSANRWWAFVLTLCLLTTCFFLITVQSPSVARAGSGSCYLPTDDPPSDSPSLGDPDVPMGPGDGKTSKFVVVHSGSNQVMSKDGTRPVGDGAVLTSVGMNRMHLFLLGLRSVYLRF